MEFRLEESAVWVDVGAYEYRDRGIIVLDHMSRSVR